MNSRRITVGVDEAGRGSLVGDMFVVGIGVVDEYSRLLVESGVRDSKTLSKSRRRRLLLDILAYSDIIVVCRVKPEEIDRENINNLEVEALKKILKHIKFRGRQPSKILVDEIAGRKKAIESVVENLFPGVEVLMKPNADRDFVQVSAASIVAKCLRDELIGILSSTYGDIGSGYPSDPRTIDWLKSIEERGSIPNCVRKSWKTLRRVCAKTLDAYIEKK
ncbi:MAG: ribonuclease HII [Sulfolobales archaeon]|nr:ribonuclease HII [Sulfolobales archaeon]MDW8082575.1 ribonuclease HII [Sulfolobales archaeon]